MPATGCEPRRSRRTKQANTRLNGYVDCDSQDSGGSSGAEAFPAQAALKQRSQSYSAKTNAARSNDPSSSHAVAENHDPNILPPPQTAPVVTSLLNNDNNLEDDSNPHPLAHRPLSNSRQQQESNANAVDDVDSPENNIRGRARRRTSDADYVPPPPPPPRAIAKARRRLRNPKTAAPSSSHAVAENHDPNILPPPQTAPVVTSLLNNDNNLEDESNPPPLAHRSLSNSRQQQEPAGGRPRRGVKRVANLDYIECDDSPENANRGRTRRRTSDAEYIPPPPQASAMVPRRFKYPKSAAPADGVTAIEIDESKWPYLNIGACDKICQFCCAPLWSEENGRGKICCNKGASVEPLKTIFRSPLPETMVPLFFGQTPEGRNFRNNIRHYNTVLSMASSGINVQNPSGGVSMLAIRGGIYHKIGPLEPVDGEDHAFAQLYILDDDVQLQARLDRHNSSGNLNRATLERLQLALMHNNQYVQQFRQIRDDIANGEVQPVELIIENSTRGPTRVYAAPSVSEVAAFLPGASEDEGRRRLLRIRYRGTGERSDIVFINDLNPSCHPLHFVLFHPRGERGWGTDLKLSMPGRKYTNLSPAMYASYFMHLRYNAPAAFRNYAVFVLGKKLYHEWLVDMFCTVDSNKLNFIQHNQAKLRAETYNKVSDAVQGGERDGNRVGMRLILPSSFIGGPRYNMQCYQDAMAVVRTLGKPDLFDTMTCNPRWPEILEALEGGQQPTDRPDIIDRVFKIKLDAHLSDIQAGILGGPNAVIYVIEFQKRGLPHAHILVILVPDDKPRTAEDIDALISAEIPDPDTHPRLHAIVMATMMHGPCGVHNPQCPCMKDGKCTKGFPREFTDSTIVGEDSFPLYRRRPGRTYKKTDAEDAFAFDNRWVVPYSPALSLKYNCHINVEVCNSISSKISIQVYL
jgi:hypothetical protein